MNNNSTHPYNTKIITQNIFHKICSGNLSLRYGVENLRTGKAFKGLAALALGYHVAEHSLDTYKFATFEQIEELHLHLAKGSRNVSVPLISKESTSIFTLTSGCYFGTHQLVGYVSESKPSFNLDLFFSKHNLTRDSSDIYFQLVNFIEDITKKCKFPDLTYNIVSAYFSDILSLNIPQKSSMIFFGKLRLNEIRQLVLTANQIVDDLILDCRHHYCSPLESNFYLAQIKSLIKS